MPKTNQSIQSANPASIANPGVPSRKGVFVGAYIDPAVKRRLQERASANYRTLSQELAKLLAESVDSDSAAVSSR